MPFEYGKTISFEDQINISIAGTNIILDLLSRYKYKATFFSTATFAIHAPLIIERIRREGHELASHGYYHSQFSTEDLANSKKKLEELWGSEVTGFRMPRMMPVDEQEIEKAGYRYNSSINPTWLPGRYNNLHVKRTYFKQGQVLQLPASVSPNFRIPLFWLSFHNFPTSLYRWLFKRAYRKDGYANIYFHPWEFVNLADRERYNFPAYVSRNSGQQMAERMDRFMAWMQEQGYRCSTTKDFIDSISIK